MSRSNVWMWWSSGKDSTWALHRLRTAQEYADFEVTALVTSINAQADRVAMHAVRTELLRAQARSLDLPLKLIELPYPGPNGAYEEAAGRLIHEAEQEGVSHMAFGDLFLEDIRAYRENLLTSSPIEPLFPVWHFDTEKMAQDVVDSGVEAYLTCVDPKVLDESFVGRPYDHDLLADLPENVDPCGENGEFHTFVANGPGFRAPILVELGETVTRDGFTFADLMPTAPKR